MMPLLKVFKVFTYYIVLLFNIFKLRFIRSLFLSFIIPLYYYIAEKGVTEEEASNRLFDTVDLAVACIAALTYLPLDVKNPSTIKGKSKVLYFIYFMRRNVDHRIRI